MAFQIEYTASALKELKKLDKRVAKDIIDYFDKNIAPLDDPTTRSEPLTSSLVGLFRYRVGDYRAICHIENETITVLVLRISHRRDVYNVDQKSFAVQAQSEIEGFKKRQKGATSATDLELDQGEIEEE